MIYITIKEIRTNVLKKSLEGMGKMLGISRQAYWLKETGRREFKCREFIAICKAANVHPFDVEF